MISSWVSMLKQHLLIVKKCYNVCHNKHWNNVKYEKYKMYNVIKNRRVPVKISKRVNSGLVYVKRTGVPFTNM